jgi:hypothetical protein
MKTIEIDDYVYDKLNDIADKIHIDINGVLSNPCHDGFFEDYYEEEIKEQEEFEYKQDWEYKHNDLHIFN